MGAEALQLGSDAVLDLELEGLEAGGVGLGEVRGFLVRGGFLEQTEAGLKVGEPGRWLTSLLVSRCSTRFCDTPVWAALDNGQSGSAAELWESFDELRDGS